jgi:hypothetical protein
MGFPEQFAQTIGCAACLNTRAPLDYFTKAVTALASIPLGG